MTGFFQVILIIGFELIRSVEIMVVLDANYMLWNMGAGMIGGLLAALVTQSFAGWAETIFGYVTDIKLLELSSLNHPLLRELIVRAPGTYHHSHLVGALAESACQAIGANGLFARVASYFHDIGKMTKSAYFVENQGKTENRHETLSPSMSALIIQNHVKDGIELAHKYRLPQPIVDIIPQHQGTKLIRYFYSKAKDQEKPAVSTVNEKDYRYPGPKPQTREAGVILLSDSVEAATRALPDKSPTKVRAIVEKVINMNFTDGQLDECELTLRDLHDISDSFTKILTGIYHKRIEYPDLPASRKERQGIHEEQDRNPQSEPLSNPNAEETPGTPESRLRDISRR
jgi:putative nucleotidyltransferase with HDIG domain